MNTTALRQKILDLAIHGKLVKQDPTDENAAVLLEKIRAEKEKKIASGELKRDKNDSYIFIGDDNRHYEKFSDGRVKDIEDELPFAVPKGWTWCRLPNLCKIPITDGTHQTPTYSDKENGIPFLSSKDVTSRKIDWSKIKYITKELHEELQKRIQPCRNDILLAKNGTTGVAALVDTDKIFDIYVTLALLRPAEVIHPNYLHYVINSPFCKKQFNGHLTGIGVPNLHLNDICKTIIPLPPLIEQHRIVTAIETIFTQIDLLEQNKADLQTTVKQAKSKILDLAIHGKLVRQDPADEPASVMLEKLRAEKEAKIAAGEIKCRKNDSYIYKNSTDNCYYQKFTDGYEADISDEIPFDVPDGWAWCRLGEIYYHTTGKALKKSNEKGSLKKYITTSNLYWDTFDLSEVRTMYFTDDELDKYTIKKGDLVLCNGGDVGRAAIWSYDKDICYQNHISRMRPKTNGIENRFFLYVLKFYKEQNMLKGKGIGISSLSASDLLSVIIPLPSLFEQQRIVAKIEELFAKLDFITAVLTE